MGKATSITEKLKSHTLEYVGKYTGQFTCLCGGAGKVGVEFKDSLTGATVILGEKCAEHYMNVSVKAKKGRRIKKSADFLNTWKG